MSRIVTTAIFGTFAVAGLAAGVRHTGHAIDAGTLAAWLTAVYALLKLLVICAFTAAVARRPPPRKHSRDPLAFAACAVAMASTLVLQPPNGHTATLHVIAGEAFAVVFAVWVVVSVFALGRCFGVLPEARGLVVRGPYRFVRHPVYLGEIGTFLGLAVATASTWSAIGAVVLIAAQWVRMGMEERALTEEFPAYADYAAGTGRLLPRLRPGFDRPIGAAEVRA